VNSKNVDVLCRKYMRQTGINEASS